jgi:hypothetical protein
LGGGGNKKKKKKKKIVPKRSGPISPKIACSVGVACRPPFLGKKNFLGEKKEEKKASSAPGYIRWA